MVAPDAQTLHAHGLRDCGVVLDHGHQCHRHEAPAPSQAVLGRERVKRVQYAADVSERPARPPVRVELAADLDADGRLARLVPAEVERAPHVVQLELDTVEGLDLSMIMGPDGEGQSQDPVAMPPLHLDRFAQIAEPLVPILADGFEHGVARRLPARIPLDDGFLDQRSQVLSGVIGWQRAP